MKMTKRIKRTINGEKNPRRVRDLLFLQDGPPVFVGKHYFYNLISKYEKVNSVPSLYMTLLLNCTVH